MALLVETLFIRHQFFHEAEEIAGRGRRDEAFENEASSSLEYRSLCPSTHRHPVLRTQTIIGGCAQALQSGLRKEIWLGLQGAMRAIDAFSKLLRFILINNCFQFFSLLVHERLDFLLSSVSVSEKDLVYEFYYFRLKRRNSLPASGSQAYQIRVDTQRGR